MQKEYKEALNTIDGFISKSNFKQALKKAKELINQLIEKDELSLLKKIITNYQLFLARDGDQNRHNLFSTPLMKYTKDKVKGYENFIDQCQVLNDLLIKTNKKLNEETKDITNMHFRAALHLAMSKFENNNHKITSLKIVNNVFWQYESGAQEANFESNIEALNYILKTLLKNKHYMVGKKFEVLYSESAEINRTLISTVRSKRFLNWVADEVSKNDTILNIDKDNVRFLYNNIDDYKYKRLPLLRQKLMQSNVNRDIQIELKKNFKWEIGEINYRGLIERKQGDYPDFRLKIASNDYVEALKIIIQELQSQYMQFVTTYYILDIAKVNIRNRKITCEQAIIFFYLIKAMALIYFNATAIFIEDEGKFPLAPYIALAKKDIYNNVRMLMMGFLKEKIENEDIDRLIEFYTFGSDDIFDLYYKPLIVDEDRIFIIPSVIMFNNFTSNFLHHLCKLKIDIDQKGPTYEMATKYTFKTHGFNVYQNKLYYPFEENGVEKNGEIDLIMMKDNVLFFAELKNRLDPIEPKDMLSVEGKINKAIYQLKNIRKYLESGPAEVTKYFGIKDMEDIIIYPFVLINCFYSSGSKRDGIPIIDTSALEKFFDGELRFFYGKQKIDSKLIRTPGEILTNEFIEFIENPYFRDDSLYPNLYVRHINYIDNKLIIIEPNINIEQHLSNCRVPRIQQFKTKVVHVRKYNCRKIFCEKNK